MRLPPRKCAGLEVDRITKVHIFAKSCVIFEKSLRKNRHHYDYLQSNTQPLQAARRPPCHIYPRDLRRREPLAAYDTRLLCGRPHPWRQHQERRHRGPLQRTDRPPAQAGRRPHGVRPGGQGRGLRRAPADGADAGAGLPARLLRVGRRVPAQQERGQPPQV